MRPASLQLLVVAATPAPPYRCSELPDERGLRMDHAREGNDDAPERTAGWAVYQCVNGCVHVRLQHVTLTFSPCEFAQLAQLIGEARARFGARAAVASVGPH